jgi:DNA-binding beta-propeller fold protein YncE
VALEGVPSSAGGRGGSGVAVVSEAGVSLRIVRVVGVAGNVAGETLTGDGRYLLAATNAGAAVLSATRAEQGAVHAVLGTLSVPPNAGIGGIEVAVSRDGRFAFVSMEGSARIAVFDLGAALADDFRTSGFVGSVPVEQLPVGLAISPDGRWLYATSEMGLRAGPGGAGTLSVIDVTRAETDPAHAVAATVPAGCGPVRVAVSPDGRVVWVTARESNALLGFSARQLTTDPARALVADVRVGPAPVGMAIIAGGRAIVVADSDRFDVPGSGAALSVVDTAAALAGRPVPVGVIRAGGFPREEALEPGGTTLLVTNYASDQLEALDTTGPVRSHGHNPRAGPARLLALLRALTVLPTEHVLLSHGPLVLGVGDASVRTATS